MFSQMQIDPDKVMSAVIENYFDNVRTFCKQDLTAHQQDTVQETGAMLIRSLVTAIIDSAEPQRQVELFELIHRRFILVLQDYDREWVWNLLSVFSEHLPEQMLH